MAAQKPRKRIVAQLVVSPTGGDRPLADAAEVDATFEPPLPQQQRDASAWASANLGPDRKVFVDLTDAAHKEVDWRKILKERGMQKPAKQSREQADPAAGDDALLLRGRSGRQENTWTRMIAKLESTFCMGDQSEDEEESDGWGDENSDSDAEEEGGEGKKEGGAAAGEGGEPGSDGADGDGHTTGGEGGGGGGKEGKGGKKGAKRAGGDYDYFDDFIDDEEFLELLEHDKRRPKHTGFFISKGEIERTEEMLPGYEELAAKKGGAKRKADGGAEEGGAPPAKKKKKVVPEAVGGAAQAPAAAMPANPPPALSIAEQARMAGQLAAAGVPVPAAAPAASEAPSPAPSQQPAGSQAPPASVVKKRGPYEMPAEVSAALARIKGVALAQPVPPVPAPGEKARRRLPKDLAAELDAFAPLFLAAEEGHGRVATNRILDDLAALEPFITKPSLGQRLRASKKEKPSGAGAPSGGTSGGPARSGSAAPVGAAAAAAAAPPVGPTTVSEADLRALITAKVQPKPVTSDDDFETAPPPPRPSTSPPAAAGEAGASQAPAQPASQAGAGAAGAQAAKAWRQLDKGVQQKVFLYIRERLGDKKISSNLGTRLAQEAYNLFPPNAVTLADIKGLYSAWKGKEKGKEKRAEAAQAQAAAGPAAPAASDTAALAAAGQAMLQGSSPQVAAAVQQQQQGAAANAAEAFATEKKLGSPQQQAHGSAAASPAAQAAPSQAAANLQAAAAAAADKAMATAIPPAAAVAGAESAGLLVRGTREAPRQPAPTDEECIRQAVAFGAPEADMRAFLEVGKASTKVGGVGYTFQRVLMLNGPRGMTSADAALHAVEWGFQAWDPNQQGIKSNLSKASAQDEVGIMYTGGGKFAMRGMPNCVERPRPHRKPGKKKKEGSAPTESSAAPGSGAGTQEEEECAEPTGGEEGEEDALDEAAEVEKEAAPAPEPAAA